jgi:hypothetical protein
VNVFKLVVAPTAPFMVIVPAPELVKESELVLATLPLVVPIAILPVPEARLLVEAPARVVVPSDKPVLVVFTVAPVKVVVLAVLVKPPVKVDVLPLPKLTPAVSSKEVALVIVLVAPLNATAYACAKVVMPPSVVLPPKVTVPVEPTVFCCSVIVLPEPLTAPKLMAPLVLLTWRFEPTVAVPV